MLNTSNSKAHACVVYHLVKCCVLYGRNSQYYEALLSVWNQLYINVKSIISWQYCMLDIQRINSLTIAMVTIHPIP